MSLQVWLPLTKDLRQQGLANTSSLSLASGNSLINGGKVGGQCLALTKLQTILENSSCMSNKKQISYAYWIKVNTAWSANWLDGIRWTSSNGTTNSVTRQEFYTNCTKVGTWFPSSSTNSISGKDFTPEVWTHLAATLDYSTGDVNFYINGVLQGHVTTLDTTYYCRGDFYIGDNGVDVSMNDVRIYDHCLSPMEVKELAKGLVLHYPLNRNGWGQENLIANTDFNGVSKKFTVTSGTEGGFTFTPTETIIANTQYTVSCRLRGNANMNLYKLCTGGNESISWVNRSQLSTTEYRYFSIIFTYPSNKTLNQIYICTRYGTANTQVGDWFEIEPSSLKLEKGSIATPWCPNSSDALATTMGLNSTTEYDCSGFCNNGIRTGTFTWISDTPKYAVSTAIEKGRITSANSFTTIADPIFSVALWFKLKSEVTYTAYTDLISFSSSSYSNQPFRLEICGSPVGKSIMWFRGPSGQSGGFAVKTDLSFDTWYHTVLVSEGNKQYSYYVNGVKLGTYNGSANSWTPTGNVFLGENLNGVIYESDFRIYATALSADDVKSLYQNCATIDPDGTIRGQIRN